MSSAPPQPVPVGEDAPILEVLGTMRAMRRLKPDPVPRELLEKLVWAATVAPSGGNEQAYEFVVVDDREKIRSLAALWRRSADAYIAAAEPEAHNRPDPAAVGRLLDALRWQRDHFHEIPAVVVACYRRRSVPRQAARRFLKAFGPGLLLRRRRIAAIGGAASVYPGVQNLLLCARALGLGANITTWHLFIEPEWKRALGIPDGFDTYAVIPVGWPLGRMGPVRRRPASEVIHWNGW